MLGPRCPPPHGTARSFGGRIPPGMMGGGQRAAPPGSQCFMGGMRGGVNTQRAAVPSAVFVEREGLRQPR